MLDRRVFCSEVGCTNSALCFGDKSSFQTLEIHCLKPAFFSATTDSLKLDHHDVM